MTVEASRALGTAVSGLLSKATAMMQLMLQRQELAVTILTTVYAPITVDSSVGLQLRQGGKNLVTNKTNIN